MGKANDQTLLDELIRHEALPLPLVKQLAKEIIELIRDGLVRDGVVNLSNFGAFRLKPVAARGGINPHTGERLTIAAHQRVIFTPCKALRELIEPNHQPPVPLEAAPLLLPTQAIALEAASTIRQVEAQAAANSEHMGETEAAVSTPKPLDAPASAARPPQPARATTTEATAAEATRGELEIDLGPFEPPPQQPPQRRYLRYGAALILLVLLLALLLMRMGKEGRDNLAIAADSSDLPATPTLLAGHATTTNDVPASTLPQDPVTPAATLYRITPGDTLWHLAATHYHEPLLWPHIYQANRDTLTDPDRLQPGEKLTIPTLQGSAAELSESDRHHIADGYYLTYQHYQAQGRSDALYALLMAKRYDASVVSRHRELLKLSLAGE